MQQIKSWRQFLKRHLEKLKEKNIRKRKLETTIIQKQRNIKEKLIIIFLNVFL